MPPGRGGPAPGGRRKRNGARIALVLSIIAGVLVLIGAGGYVGYEAYWASSPKGSEYSPADLPPACDLLSESTLDRVDTSNPNDAVSGESTVELTGQRWCSWNQAKGRDGSDRRSSDIRRFDGGHGTYSDDPVVEAREHFAEEQNDPLVGTEPTNTSPIEGVGNEAIIASEVGGASSFRQTALIVRKGPTVLSIEYSGWNYVIFGSEPIPTAEREQVVRELAEEALANL